MKLINQKVLITGGGSGIGLALAKKFLENNNTVIVTGRDLAKLERVKSDYPDLNIFQSDVTKMDQVEKLANYIQEQYGGVDILVNNAGVMRMVNTANEANDISEQMDEIDINFSSPIRVLYCFLSQLKRSQSAAVVNVSSTLAYVPMTQVPVYSATKAALHSWTKSVRLHLKPHNIEVYELLPPVVDTPMSQDSGMGQDDSVKPLSPEKLANDFWDNISKGNEEITPGVSKLLKIMSRVAPNFIFKQLNKVSTPKS